MKKLSTRLVVLTLSSALCLVLVEASARLVVPANPPGTTWGQPIERNELGLRDPARAYPHADGTIRVLGLGDSFAWGVGMPVEATAFKLLERQLNLGSQLDSTVEVVNAAEPGFNTVEEFNRLQELGPVLEPDIVLVLFNLNDIEYLPELALKEYSTESVTPVVEIDPGESISKYSRNSGARGLLLRIERRSVAAQIAVPRIGTLLRRAGLLDSVEFSWVEKIYEGYQDENPGWLEVKRGLVGIRDWCRSNNCQVLVAVFPLFVDLERYGGEEVHETLLQFATEQGIEMVDLLPLFKGSRTRSHWINFMDSHPSPEVHARVAEHLEPVLRGQIRSLENRNTPQP